ncbi:3-dehydroquinate synthase [Pectinatus haikarae]|uniref:3-dehydroquinate synthase n=1 Tax=Pectinatus haikarae TaxID=349096 RepID=UPI0018C4FFDF|nr:3-dehydroquinate synthase [Pectinatus haikarae]
MKTVTVPIINNSYDIYIDNNLHKTIADFFAGSNFSRTALVVTDSNVGKLYGEKITDLLRTIGFSPRLAILEAGEKTKSFTSAQDLYTEAIKAGLDRKSPIIALGGGVVGDLAGFIAATYMRGVPFIQIPTSLLAHVDSSVGGKVAVNHPLGKNLIGAFYQPKAVFIDLDMLQTLPAREISTGLAEIIKYGLIYDKTFFDYIADHSAEIFTLNNEILRNIIARSCEIKASVVAEDEKETGLRAILNFGHTLGHAIERETRYKKYNHGEAVAIGMLGAAAISCELGFIEEDTVSDIRRILDLCRLPDKCTGCSEAGIYNDLFHDKKTVGGKINWILLDEIGKVHLDDTVPEKVVHNAIKNILFNK